MVFIKAEAGASDPPGIIEIAPLGKHIGVKAQRIQQAGHFRNGKRLRFRQLQKNILDLLAAKEGSP